MRCVPWVRVLVGVLVLGSFSCVSVQPARVPTDVFSLGDVMAVRAVGEGGSSATQDISVKPLRAAHPRMQDVVMARYDRQGLTPVPHEWAGSDQIRARVEAGNTYLIYGVVPGRLADTHDLLCRVRADVPELERISPLLPDRICQVILCAPNRMPAEELFTRMPELAPFRDRWDVQGRVIGGWEPRGPGNICDQCLGWRKPTIVPPPSWRCPRNPVPSVAVTDAMVVDMVPRMNAAETWQDSEPFLSVHPTNSAVMGGSAFTMSPLGGASPNAPIYVTQDAGLTWTLRDVVPSPGMTGDITHAHSGAVANAYSGILRRGGGLRMDFLLCNNVLTCPPMTRLLSRAQADQPFVQVVTIGGVDRIYVGSNDFNATGGRTATVDVSLDGGATFTARRIETRSTAGQNGPSVRPAAARDGTVYAAFFGWRGFSGSTITTDIVVVRDDAGATGTTAFRDLTDPSDNLAGRLVATNVPSRWSNAPTLGNERIGSTLSLAVDPNASDTVYVAWADTSDPTAVYTVHVRRSTDRGQTWSSDILTVKNATNVALAVDDRGTLGVLYQQVVGAGAGQRWETHVRLRPKRGNHFSDTVLARVPVNAPAVAFLPYLGDYAFLLAEGTQFRGVFSANNSPDMANFPQGVRFQRPWNPATKQLLDIDGNVVPTSIDPFYFRVRYQLRLGPSF